MLIYTVTSFILNKFIDGSTKIGIIFRCVDKSFGFVLYDSYIIKNENSNILY